MKKFALALMAAATAVFGVGMVAEAYPPGGNDVDGPASDPAAGAAFSVDYACTEGEDVTVTHSSTTAVLETGTGVCTEAGTSIAVASMLFQASDDDDDAGSVTANVTAATEPGTYTVSATGSVSGDLGSYSYTIAAQTAPTGGLPATGSDGVGTTTWIAAGLLIVGLGLFGVATMRRRQPTVA